MIKLFKTFIKEQPEIWTPKLKKELYEACRIIVEHESQETFMKMIQSPEHQEFHPKLHSFMSAEPVKKMFTTSVE